MKRILSLLAFLALALAPGCRTATTWDAAKRAICNAKDGTTAAVDAAAAPFGLPGTIVGGLLKTALTLVCNSVDVAAEAAKGVTTTVIDTPTQAVGSIVGIAAPAAAVVPKP